jgi:hypothetical protein
VKKSGEEKSGVVGLGWWEWSVGSGEGGWRMERLSVMGMR